MHHPSSMNATISPPTTQHTLACRLKSQQNVQNASLICYIDKSICTCQAARDRVTAIMIAGSCQWHIPHKSWPGNPSCNYCYVNADACWRPPRMRFKQMCPRRRTWRVFLKNSNLYQRCDGENADSITRLLGGLQVHLRGWRSCRPIKVVLWKENFSRTYASHACASALNFRS